MISKTSMKFDVESHVYRVKSKSLTAALSRASLIVQALGDKAEIEHLPPAQGKRKHTLVIYPY